MTSIVITCLGHCGRTVTREDTGRGLLAASNDADNAARDLGWYMKYPDAYCPECQAKREAKPRPGHEFKFACRWLSLPYRHQHDIMRGLGMNPRGDAETDGLVLLHHAFEHGKLATLWHEVNKRCAMPIGDTCPFEDRGPREVTENV